MNVYVIEITQQTPCFSHKVAIRSAFSQILASFVHFFRKISSHHCSTKAGTTTMEFRPQIDDDEGRLQPYPLTVFLLRSNYSTSKVEISGCNSKPNIVKVENTASRMYFNNNAEELGRESIIRIIKEVI